MILNNEQETLDLGATFARNWHKKTSLVIHLDGDLGAGKSTFARGFIQYFGFNKVKSPTYSLVETYKKNNITINHFDIYRLDNPEELEFIGIRDYQDNGALLIEWADKGKGFLPSPDIAILLKEIDNMRNVSFKVGSTVGKLCLEEIS